MLTPVILLIIDVASQVLFQDGINSLSLAISLGMEAGGEILGDANKFAQSSGEYRGKLGASIRYMVAVSKISLLVRYGCQ